MKYYLGLTLLLTCGFVASGSALPDGDVAANVTEHAAGSKTSKKFTGKFTDDKLARDRLHRSPRTEPAVAAGDPIPVRILPNNVCVINTDISPDRTIEEHIVACIKAYKVRQSLTQR